MTKVFRDVFYTVCNDNRKEKLMDWTGDTNWRNEKLKKKKRLQIEGTVAL